jgi:hypothetical protein
MRLGDKFTKIPNDYINGEKKLESDKLFLLTILLQGRTPNDVCFLSVRYLCNRLNTTTGNTNRTKYIIDTLKYFQEHEILFFSDENECEDKIDIDETIKQNKMDIFFAELYNDMDNNFTMLYHKELNTILEYCNNNKIDKYIMVHLYLYIIRLIENNEQAEKYKLSFPKIESIAEVVDISENTVLKYLKVLKDDMKLLYYNSVGYKIVNGKYKATNMYYCRIEDKELLDYRIKNEQKDKGIISLDKQSKNKINNKRSLKQKINILNKKIDKTDEEIIKLKQLEEEYKQIAK